MDILLLRHVSVICLLSGVVGLFASATPLGRSIEESFGLACLFKLRGKRTAPSEAVIYAIEKKSAEFLGVKQQPYKWPRTIHAEAVNRLTDMGASAIGFDLFFEESRSAEDDKVFGKAIGDSGKVVLLQRLKRNTSLLKNTVQNSISSRSGILSEQLIPTVPVLEKEARSLAPFPLPQSPVRLDQAWLFKAGAGELATFPVAMFAMFQPEQLQRVVRLLALADPSAPTKYTSLFVQSVKFWPIDTLLQTLKSIFLADPNLAAKVKAILDREELLSQMENPSEINALHSMLRVFTGDRSVYINYYGPPGTVTTFPYYELFEEETGSSRRDLTGKAVFIGLTHDAELGEKDGFYTTFTSSEGRHISGVEVAATIFANLVDGSVLTPVHSFWSICLIFAVAMGIGTASNSFTPAMAGVVGLCFCLVYLFFAYFLFAFRYLWVPWVVPLMIQAPLTHLSVSLLKHRKILRDKKNIKKALECYVPKSIAAEVERDFLQIAKMRDDVQAICLYSDLENYTALSERLSHHELTGLVNLYYQEVFKIVKQHSGMVLDVRGDSMLAIWLSDESGGEPVRQSCHAALSISTIFNDPASDQKHHLPTRIGLHRGRISLGNIGSLDHFQYTVTGDTVNTVARIESFNKQLGTRLLVSESIAQHAGDFECRRMGTFLFVGKKKPLAIYQLLGRKGELSTLEQNLSINFAKGLKSFQAGQWARSEEIFKHCRTCNPEYGPARWFQELSRTYGPHRPAESWNGVIQLEKK